MHSCCRHNFPAGVCTCMLPKPTQSSRVRTASENNVLQHSPNITKVAFACTKCALCYMAQPAHCTSCFQGFSGGPIHFCFCRSFTWSFMGPLGHSRFTGMSRFHIAHTAANTVISRLLHRVRPYLSISFHLIRQPSGRLMFGPGSWERDSYVALIEILRRHRLSRF